MTTSPPRAFARIDAIAAVGVFVTLACLLLPVLGGGRGTALRDVSANNLRIIQQGLACYAVEWDDRQFSTAPANWGDYDGDCDAWVDDFGYYSLTVTLGWGCTSAGSCHPDYLVEPGVCGNAAAVWGYYSYGGSYCYRDVFEPIVFDEGSHHLGAFRFPNVSPVHDFVVPAGYGRHYDPVFYAPADTSAHDAAAVYFDEPCEYIHDPVHGAIPSSYVLSPAALFNPSVFRSALDGGFQAPTSIQHGFRAPTLSQTLYPEQKTWVMEHHWLDDAPAACHPTLSLPFFDFTADCQPYLFNGGRDASPLAAFYDGSVRTVRAGDVELAEQRMLRSGAGQLWSRDTPMGEDGYFGEFAVDDVRVSHHILTTDGIRGRDWLGPQPRRAIPPQNNTGDQP